MKEKTTKKDKYKDFVDLMCKLYYGCLCAYGRKEAKKYISDTVKLLDTDKIRKLKQCAN